MDDVDTLTKLAQKGDKNAFGAIYNLFYKKIYRYCMYNLNNQQQALDICQDTFLKAWKSLPSFSQNSTGTLQAYLFKIAKNLIIDGSRKKKTESLEFHQNLQAESNFEETIDTKNEISKLNKVIASLPEKEKQIIILHYFEQLPGSQIAKIVGVREGALRVRTHRIINKLKEKMEKYYD